MACETLALGGMPDWTEDDRLEALRKCQILDTAPERSFDDMAELAAMVCGAPSALVSFVDEKRQWFKARVGMDVAETPREISICSVAIQSGGVFVVPDTTKDPRFKANPSVTGRPYIRFYAGAVLEAANGLPLGTLCVWDTDPRPQGLTKEQSSALSALARAVTDKITLRHINADLRDSLDENQRKTLLFDTAIEKLKKGLCFFDRDRRLVACNDRYRAIYGLTADQTRAGTSAREIVDHVGRAGNIPDISPAELMRLIEKSATEVEPFDTVIELKNGRTVAIHYEPMPGEGWVATHEDITDELEAQAAVRRLADEDSLTGLPNRRKFSEFFDEALTRAKANGTCVSLLVVDLDDFKDVNDTLGHDAGDALLRETARRLQLLKPAQDAIGRIGGDEFAILLSEPFTPENAFRFAEHAVDVIKAPFSYEGRLIASSVSIGVAAYPDDESSQPYLMKAADLAMYSAKTVGKSRVVRFTPKLRAAAEERVAVLTHVREGLEADEIVPFYQPKISLSSGRIVGFEALARWQHPVKGLLTPGHFGAAFAHPELSELIGQAMLRKVSADMAVWLERRIEFGRVALNFSSSEFARPDLAAIVLTALEDQGIPSHRFEAEVTEGVFLGATSANVLGILQGFKSAGIKIALDDFGTGFASLTHLKQFPVNHIKVDQSFVKGLGKMQSDEAIVSSVVSLAKNFGMDVTAEGVETEGQALRLAQMGCDFGQGYLFAKPMAGSRVPWFIENWAGWNAAASLRSLAS